MRVLDAASVLGGISESTITSQPNQGDFPTLPLAAAFPHQSTSNNLRDLQTLPAEPTSSFILSNSVITHIESQTLNLRLPKISTAAIGNLERALSHGWASSTLRGYDSHVKQFLRWCDTENIPIDLRFPADEFILCAFAASDVGRLSGGTVRKKISALKAWHAAHNVPWLGSKRITYIINGVDRLAPDSSKLPPRPPISAHMLSILADTLDLSNGFDAAVLACSTTAFWGQCRLGELISTNSRNFSTSGIPARAHLHHSRNLSTSTSRILHLPRTKVNQARGEDVVLVHQTGNIDPILTLSNHIQCNPAPKNAPLFTYRSSKAPYGLRVLTRAAFLKRCNEVWSSHGFPITTGHSFRIGGTTELLLAGVSPKVVKAMGRWSSDAFLRYWRSLEDLAPLHARNIKTRNKSAT